VTNSRDGVIFLVVWPTAIHQKNPLQMLAVRLIAGWMRTLRAVVRVQVQASLTHPENSCNDCHAAFILDFSIRPKLKE